MDCLYPPAALTGSARPAGTDYPTPDQAGSLEAAWSTGLAAGAIFLIAALLASGGCTNQVSLLPNADPALRKTAAEFAADAAKRNPYPAAAPRGGEAVGRAAVDYGADTLAVVNLSDEDWDGAEVWVNGQYVVFVPRINKGANSVKTLNFAMLYDGRGKSFPTTNQSVLNPVRRVEIFRDGKLYDLRFQLAD